jgi:hypothetical protein
MSRQDAKREPERPDLYAVKDVAEGVCTCPVGVLATKSELTFAQFKHVVCKACQAKACCEWVMEISEEG